MPLDDWIAALGDKVLAAGRNSRRTVEYLLPRLNDFPAEWFTDAAIEGIYRDLRSLNSADRVRSALREFHAAQRHQQRAQDLPQERERREWEERQAWLREDWDDPASIMRKVHDCRGNVMMLRLLGQLVRKWAPRHLGYLPPHIIAAIETDAEIAPHDRHLRFADDTPPPGTRSVAEQLAALGVEAPGSAPQPRYLTPEQLDRINPLPGGVKKRHAHAAANDQGTIPPDDPAAA